ncbi:MAG TPA: DNA translocase FtsK 4TM domain-containing protein, partial [Afifellaceae bacterium]|nr:DNA translocase FtsK 4TM domain-containing protein [Afifellaceae bacterium]
MTYGATYETPHEFSLRAFLARKAAMLGGLALLSVAVAAIVSLATWHVNDPSLSHATDEPARNLLGMPGAIFADLAMQFFGLAIVAILYSALVNGWNMLRHRRPRSGFTQSVATLAGAIVLAAALACLPVMGQWPLPTGLGGVIGDMVLKLPETLFGSGLSAGLRAAFGTVFAGFALALIYMACGREQRKLEPVFEQLTPGSAEPDYDEEEDERGDYLNEDEGAPGTFSLAAGFIAHWGLLARAAIRRRLLMRPLPRWSAHKRSDSDDEHGYFDDGSRQEPIFGDHDPDYELAAAPQHPASGDDDRGSVRITAPAARPRPGRRVLREAQPSLLGSSGYELPPLHLLDEPKQRKKDPSLNTAALEQNARLLEGVLEDFGVRGEIINVRPGPVVTLYELEPAPGIKSSRVIGLADDIARS